MQQVLYASASGQIIQWQDTAAFSYPTAPSGTATLAVTSAQWDAQGPAFWVDNGVLTAGSPPAPSPTLAQQAAAMLAAGIEIVSTANPSTLGGTYPCDQATLNDDGNILSAIGAGLTLPGGVAVRLDTSGVPHNFAAADFKNLCQAKLYFTLTLNTIIGSNSGTLPTLPVTIA